MIIGYKSMQITDRRKMPRYQVSLNAILTTLEGHVCLTKVLDISASGLRCQLNTSEMGKIIATDIQENRLSPISIILDIDIQEAESQASVSRLKIQCGIVFLQRKNLDLSILGCRFEEFYDNASDRLGKYLLKLKDKPGLKIT